MLLNDLLRNANIDPEEVLVFRHRPFEPELNRVLPWLAAERPHVFNAYQQTQGEKVEKAMASLCGRGYVASFIGHQPSKALFIGLYSIGEAAPITYEEYWRVPAYVEMKAFGMRGQSDPGPSKTILWFDLRLTDFRAAWKGRLVVDWPPPERSWWRRAHRNEMSVLAIHEESVLDKAMPHWSELTMTWEELKVLPRRWQVALSEWRGVYYISDVSDGKGYVGAAYGEQNLYGRWLNYSEAGHGGNKLLRQRDPRQFRFSILERVSPDMTTTEIAKVESSWKMRLHTRHPKGLNDN